MNPARTPAANLFDPLVVAFTETPPRRRFVRPLQQRVDFKFVHAEDVDRPAVDPSLYDHAGHAARRGNQPGRLLNVRA